MSNPNNRASELKELINKCFKGGRDLTLEDTTRFVIIKTELANDNCLVSPAANLLYNCNTMLNFLIILESINQFQRYLFALCFWYSVGCIYASFKYNINVSILILILSVIISTAITFTLGNDELFNNVRSSTNKWVQLMVLLATICLYSEYVAISIIAIIGDIILMIFFYLVPFLYETLRRNGATVHAVYIAGEPSIIADRVDITNINIEEVINDYNNTTEGYCFLRVLKKEDVESFFEYLKKHDDNKFVNEVLIDMYQRRAIKLDSWISIMKNMKLYNHYRVYRRSYFGENSGRKTISTTLTNYLLPLWFMDRNQTIYENKNENYYFASIIKLFSGLTISDNIVRLIIENNHIEIADMNIYKISSYANPNVIIENEYYGY